MKTTIETSNRHLPAVGNKPSRYATPVLLARGAVQVGGDRMLSIAGVVSKIGASRAAIYDWMSHGAFPRPVKLGPRRVAWRESALDTWLSQREAA